MSPNPRFESTVPKLSQNVPGIDEILPHARRISHWCFCPQNSPNCCWHLDNIYFLWQKILMSPNPRFESTVPKLSQNVPGIDEILPHARRPSHCKSWCFAHKIHPTKWWRSNIPPIVHNSSIRSLPSYPLAYILFVTKIWCLQIPALSPLSRSCPKMFLDLMNPPHARRFPKSSYFLQNIDKLSRYW